jgi:succinyl-CoA synthetase alpha subunit
MASYRSTVRHLHLTRDSRILFQNLTGRAATMHARLSVRTGRTNLVAGTSAKQAGGTHDEFGVPLFASVREAKRHTRIDATAVFVPPVSAADAIIEAIAEEIPLVVAVAEGIPTRDQMLVMSALQSQSKSRLLGANSPGYTSPYGPRLGIAPVAAASRGCVGE